MSVTNLYPPFSSSSENYNLWTATGEYLAGQPVYRKSTQYGGTFNAISRTAEEYVYSLYVKTSIANTTVYLNADAGNIADYIITSASGSETVRISANSKTASFDLETVNHWYRLSIVFTLNSDVTIKPFCAKSTNNNAYIYISAPMLETGSTLHDFVPYGGWPWKTVNDKPFPTQAISSFQHDFAPPLPLWYWKTDILSKYSPIVTPPMLQSDFEEPLPSSYWRGDASNDGKPYHKLMPNIVHYVPPPPPPPPTPTIDPVEFYDEYNAEYLSALRQKHRRYKVRVELLGYYENVVGEITRDLSRGASGSITINNEQITRRSCSLSLINVDKKYLPSPDSPIWFNRKFKLWIGIVTGKHTYWWSYGVFFTTKATCDGATLNIQGIDKGGALDGTIKTGMLDAENVIERGTTLTNVIKDTLMWNEFSSPYLRHNTGASSYPVDPIAPIIDTKFDKITTQAEITINANDYISTLFSSIADGYGADAYYNTNGHFVFQTMADDSRIDGYRFMAHQWDFKDTDEMYSNASIEYNMDGFNVVTVYTNESTLENVSYTASNNNPASPLRLDSAGIRRMSDVEIPYINVAQNEMVDRCKAYADYLLMKEAMDRMSLTFTCPIIPHLDVNRTIGVTDKRYNLESATFIINSITMPLSAESMTINATSTEWLPDDTSIEGGAD